MTMYRRALAAALGVFMALSLLASPAALAMESREEPVRAIVTFTPDAPVEALLSAMEALPETEVLWTYERLFSGAAVDTTPSALEKIAALPGVEAAAKAGLRQQEALADGEIANSLELLDLPETADYTGDGIVIAVIDSGFRLSHDAFSGESIAQSPALSQEDIAAFIQDGGTAGRYVSDRVPFAYDYWGQDNDVSTTDAHGTHVAALAMGRATNEEGAVIFQGVAPAAQLLAMKVFPDGDGEADDAVIMRALEDAAALGADVINLSLGTPGGFTGDDVLRDIYNNAFASLRQQGIILCCSAGNAAVSTSADTYGSTLPSGGYTDYGTVSAPATYLGSTAIASADALHYPSQSYIAVGDRKLSFQDATAEDGGTLPSLMDLDGETLPLVVVPGLGTAEDFASVDVSGKVALVARGQLTFTEKAANAAAAGAVACLIANNEPGAIYPTLESTIPCAAISQEDGDYLRALAEEGPVSLTFRDETYSAVYASQPTVSDFSSWGVTSDLRLLPALTAPGGNVISASVEGDSRYISESGTSMASPNAAGSFAVMLEALADRGITGKEAADLAEALLESTALVMTDEACVPLSPRQQGAGLIQLSDAEESPLVITNPLVELGDSTSGYFTMKLTLQNLSDEDITLTRSLTALTDDYIEEDGRFYSLLAPMDITDSVSVSGPQTVTVPAGGETSVTLTLSVDSALRRDLAEPFPNGFFTEGFVTFTSEDGTAVHAAFLGYCGDWKAAPILSDADFTDVLDAAAQEAEDGEKLAAEDIYVDRDLGVNMAYISNSGFRESTSLLLGENLYQSVVYDTLRCAMPGGETDALYTAGSLLATEIYTLRNARRIIMVVSDQKTGQVLSVVDQPYVSKSMADPSFEQAFPLDGFYWDGTDIHGDSVPGGTQVMVSFYAWLENDQAMETAYQQSGADGETPSAYRWLLSSTYDRCLQWRFSLTVDDLSPEISLQQEDGGLTVTVTDDHFLSYAAIRDESGNLLAEEVYADEEAGQAHTLTLSDEELPETVYITASDYASNTTGYAVSLTDEEWTYHLCAAALLTDVAPNAWYHEAVDYVYTLGLMAGSEPLTFQPTDAATRAQVIYSLYQLSGAPETETAAEEALPFTDVAVTDWYYDALCWAWENDIAQGYSDTLFGALAPVKRQQLAVMFQRFDALTEETGTQGDLSAFSDKDAVSAWAQEAVAWAVGEGLLSGSPEGQLNPQGNTTRAELAQILMNYVA